ncbi:hypothetical protein [Mesorhizobium sp. J428]|uniref:hypothetical protein n=1 Tax=Mesorhizobium sp. J428 TaxID=2898440 RepID=UPI0021507755|nr:hypothetical protein [Mesorhizobium sp. J428]MCR5859710.1 hypothetical protein [Mesorhizobium sp. J428]
MKAIDPLQGGLVDAHPEWSNWRRGDPLPHGFRFDGTGGEYTVLPEVIGVSLFAVLRCDDRELGRFATPAAASADLPADVPKDLNNWRWA